jgi:hypothetical protein
MIEGALSTLFWVPLLLGVLYFGSALVTALQVVQVDRDAGHMFARGVYFGTDTAGYANETLLARLGQQLGLASVDGSGNVTGVSTTGPMVIILTKIQNVSANACVAYNGVVGGCANVGDWVVTQRLNIGNSTLRQSNYTPSGVPSADLDPTSGVVVNGTNGNYTYPLYLQDSSLRLTGFNLITISATGFPTDTPAYLAEAFLQTPVVPGFPGSGGLYMMTIF